MAPWSAANATTTAIDTASQTIGAAIERASAVRLRIRDADDATETAALTRSQIRRAAASAMVAPANQLPRQVLALLRQKIL